MGANTHLHIQLKRFSNANVLLLRTKLFKVEKLTTSYDRHRLVFTTVTDHYNELWAEAEGDVFDLLECKAIPIGTK